MSSIWATVPRRLDRRHALSVDPGGDFVGVEADELAQFHERDAPFCHETAYENHLDAQPFGQALHVEKRCPCRGLTPDWVRTS